MECLMVLSLDPGSRPGGRQPRHRRAQGGDAADLADLPEPAADVARLRTLRPLFAQADHLRHRSHAGEHAGANARTIPCHQTPADLRPVGVGHPALQV